MADLRTAVLALRAAIEPDSLRRLGLKSSVAFGRFVALYRKYSENQPRDELGRWTEGHGGAGSEGDDDGLTTGTIVTLRKDRTGDPLIDAHTDVFEAHMKLVMEIVGDGSGMSYGREVHQVFADSVRNSNLPGIFVEQNWSQGESVSRSNLDGVRTDVFLRDENGRVLAVWDLKTGTAYLPPSRVDQMRRVIGIGQNVPIFEMQALKGITIKADYSWNDMGPCR